MDYVWVLLFGCVLGFAAAWMGSWYRLARIESDLRHIGNEAADYRDHTGETLPADWFADQVDWLVKRNF